MLMLEVVVLPLHAQVKLDRYTICSRCYTHLPEAQGKELAACYVLLCSSSFACSPGNHVVRCVKSMWICPAPSPTLACHLHTCPTAWRAGWSLPECPGGPCLHAACMFGLRAWLPVA
jgi:hypothetical protein